MSNNEPIALHIDSWREAGSDPRSSVSINADGWVQPAGLVIPGGMITAEAADSINRQHIHELENEFRDSVADLRAAEAETLQAMEALQFAQERGHRAKERHREAREKFLQTAFYDAFSRP